MSGKKRAWPAAGLIALTALAGCVREPNVATRNAAAILETQEEGGMPEGAATSPEAVHAGQPAKTLSPDPLDSPAGTSVMDARRSAEMAETMAGGDGHDSHAGHGGHGGHGATGTYRHVDVGREPAETEETTAVVYACPMHPEVTSNEPGTCSKCGMALVERREE